VPAQAVRRFGKCIAGAKTLLVPASAPPEKCQVIRVLADVNCASAAGSILHWVKRPWGRRHRCGPDAIKIMRSKE